MKILAIGGGEIGRSGTRIETLAIDRVLLAASRKKHPRLLFVPTASHDSEDYIQVVERYFGKKLGCVVDNLLLWDKQPSKSQTRSKINSADIIYVGGGNTLSMLKLWRKLGIDRALKHAASKGKILAGVSAGAVCWFRYASSDSRRMSDPTADYIRIRGLDLIPLLLVPHFDKEEGRQASLKRMLKGTRQIAVGLDNCAALEISQDTCRIITSRPKAAGYRCYWRKGKYFKETLPIGKSITLSHILIHSEGCLSAPPDSKTVR